MIVHWEVEQFIHHVDGCLQSIFIGRYNLEIGSSYELKQFLSRKEGKKFIDDYRIFELLVFLVNWFIYLEAPLSFWLIEEVDYFW